MGKPFFAATALLLLYLCPVPVHSQDNLLTESQKAAAEAAVALQSTPKPEEVKKVNYWTNSLQTKLDFGQTSLTNWSAGGYNSFSLKTFIDANANYSKDKMF